MDQGEENKGSESDENMVAMTKTETKLEVCSEANSYIT